MIAADSRPAIWAAYFELAQKRPWLGVGLGRSVPSRAYRLENDEVLRRIDLQAPSHAHNVLLDLVLQVGVIGLALWLWLHIEILRLAWQRARSGDDREKAWVAAAVALVLSLLMKNSTNDVTVYGNAILFWALLGTTLYLLMGWVVLVAIRPLWLRMPHAGFVWIFLGGLAYSAGVIFYAVDYRMRYSHFIWHLFVLLGSSCHFLAILSCCAT